MPTRSSALLRSSRAPQRHPVFLTIAQPPPLNPVCPPYAQSTFSERTTGNILTIPFRHRRRRRRRPASQVQRRRRRRCSSISCSPHQHICPVHVRAFVCLLACAHITSFNISHTASTRSHDPTAVHAHVLHATYMWKFSLYISTKPAMRIRVHRTHMHVLYTARAHITSRSSSSSKSSRRTTRTFGRSLCVRGMLTRALGGRPHHLPRAPNSHTHVHARLRLHISCSIPPPSPRHAPSHTRHGILPLSTTDQTTVVPAPPPRVSVPFIA